MHLTKEPATFTIDELILGFEACAHCGWRNVFQDGAPIHLQLVSGRGLEPRCPICGAVGQRWLLASPIPYDDLFPEEFVDQIIDESATRAKTRLTVREHIIAGLHWLAPFEEESRLWLCIIGSLWLLIGLIALPFIGLEALAAEAQLTWVITKIFLIWRGFIAALWLLGSWRQHRLGRRGPSAEWRKLSRQRFFPYWRARHGR